MDYLPYIEIDTSKTAMENMHTLLMSTAVEEIPMEEYELDPPLPYSEFGNTYHNTSVVIRSTAPDKRTGEDNHYYHRVDVGNKGLKSTLVPGIKIIAKPMKLTKERFDQIKTQNNITDDKAAIIKFIAEEVDLVWTEFDLIEYQPTGDNAEEYKKYTTHVLVAKENSYLYINQLGIKILFENNGKISDILPGFEAKPEEEVSDA